MGWGFDAFGYKNRGKRKRIWEILTRLESIQRRKKKRRGNLTDSCKQTRDEICDRDQGKYVIVPPQTDRTMSTSPSFFVLNKRLNLETFSLSIVSLSKMRMA